MADLVYGSGDEQGLPKIDLPSMGNAVTTEEQPAGNIPTITVRPNAEQAPTETEQLPIEQDQSTQQEPPINTSSYTTAIQEALHNGYSKEEVASFLQSKGVEPDDADLAITDSVKTKVKSAKDSGYSDEEISTYLVEAGYDQDLVAKSVKASSVDEKYRQLDYKPAELTDEDKAMELSDLYTNVYQKYSTMGKQLVGVMDEDTALDARREVNKLNYGITEKLKKEGLDAFIDDSSGSVMVRNKEGNVSEVDSSFLQSLWNSKGEIGGAITGGIAGARAGAVIGSVVPGIGTAVGSVAGAIGGSAIGASLGKGIDLAINAQKLSEDISASLYMTQMKQAGIFDATMGVLVPTAFKIGAKGYRSIAKAYKYFTHGNPSGAYKALKYNLNISDDEVKAIVDAWENLNKVAAPGDSFEEKAIGVVTQTRQGADGTVKAAAAQNERVATVLRQAIDTRAKGVQKALENITDDNVGALVQKDLQAYRQDVKNFFDTVKKQASSEIDGTDFRFDLDKLAITPVLKNIEKKLSNPIMRERFVSYATRIENASQDRTFSGLLEMRSAVNDFKYSKTLSPPDMEALNTVINKIDGQIGKAVKEYMPQTGKEWLENFKLAKVEYSKMKVLEENALYRQLTRPAATEEVLQKSISRFGNDTDVDAEMFNKVVERLAPATRVKVEGAAIKNVVKKWTFGHATEEQAVHFPALAEELAGLNLKTTEAKNLAKVIKEIAEVYKNDPDLAGITGKTAMARMQATLSADLTQKAKYAIIGALWNNIVRYLPTRGANNLALVHHTAKLLENPMHAVTADTLVKQLPVTSQPAMLSLVKDLQVQIAKQGGPRINQTANMYKQTTTGKLAVTDGQLGKGVYLVDKVKSPTPGSQVVKQVVDPTKLATLDNISSIVGRDVTVKDVRNIPNLQQQLTDRGFIGIKVDDKAVIFSEKATPSVIKESTQQVSSTIAKDGDVFFNPSVLDNAKTQSSYSREKLVYMDPNDFLLMAEKEKMLPNKQKTETVSGVINRGEKFSDLPKLSFENNGDGTAKVVSHEGRHRARELIKRGIKEMPVVIKSQEGGRGPSIRWGTFEGDIPSTLVGQNREDKISFPVKKVAPSIIKDVPKSDLPFTQVVVPRLYHGSDVIRQASTIRGKEGVTYFTSSKALAEEAFTSEGGKVSSFISTAKIIDAEKDKEFISFVRNATNLTGSDEEVLVDSLTGAGSKLGENKFKLLIDYLNKVGADGVKIGSEVIVPNSKTKTVLRDF